MGFESIWDWLFVKFDPLLRPSHGGIPVEIVVNEILASMERAAGQKPPSTAFLRHIVSRFLCLLFPDSTLCASGFLDAARENFLVRRLSRSESAERESRVPRFPDEARELFAKEIRDEIQGRRSARSLLSLARSPPSASMKRSRTWITPDELPGEPYATARSLSLPPLAPKQSLRDLAELTLERSAQESDRLSPTATTTPPSKDSDPDALFTRLPEPAPASMTAAQRFAQYERQFEWLYQNLTEAKRARTAMQQEYRQQNLALSNLVQAMHQRIMALEATVEKLRSRDDAQPSESSPGSL